MKFVCEKSILSDSISIVSKAINNACAIDISKDKIKMSGSDLDLSIESVFDAEIYEEGSLIVDARIFADIVRKLPDGPVEIETDSKNELKINCLNTKFNILYLSSEGYPEIKKIEDGDSFKIYSKDLKSVIKNTIFAISNNESRPILTGSKFEITNSNLKVISIDGYRLALRNQVIPETDYDNLSFVVPGRALNEMLKILKDDATIVEITIRENSVMFSFDTFVVTSRLLEGEFMDYNKFIPTNASIMMTTDVKKFTSMVERASIIINYDDPKIPIILNIEDNNLNVECISKKGNFDENMEIEHHGDNLKIGIASKLLLDTLKSIDAESAVFEFNSAQSPCVIKPVEGKIIIDYSVKSNNTTGYIAGRLCYNQENL